MSNAPTAEFIIPRELITKWALNNVPFPLFKLSQKFPRRATPIKAQLECTALCTRGFRSMWNAAQREV